MTKQEQLEVLTNEIAELIKAKNEQIQFLRWKVADLTAKLEEAEGKVDAE